MMRRSLAVVLAADVAAYSRLMGEDALGTLADLRRVRRSVFDPIVAGRRGRVVKSMGDGWLVVFGSAVEAVECALQVQDRLAAEPRVRLRMGLHLGDVAEADDDVFGEAVNVASRLQALAEPGAVAISDAVYAALDGTLRPSFEDAGLRRLRHIALPVRVWLRGGEVAGGSAERGLAGFPRLALAPVATPEASPALKGLADALTGDFLTFLGGTQWLNARIAARPEPGAYALSATLRAQGDRLRLDAALAAPDGVRLWSARREGAAGDPFGFQDAAAPTLATEAFRQLLTHAGRAAEATPPAARAAEQWALLAIARGGADGDGHREAVAHLAEAIRLDPGWGYAHALAATLTTAAVALGLGDHVEPFLARRVAWLDRAEALEPAVSPARIMLAFATLARTGDPESVRATVRRQLQGLPFEPDVLIWAGYVYLYMGEGRAALECFEKFERGLVLDAYAPSVKAGAAGALLQLGDDAAAIARAEEATRLSPRYPSPLRIRAAACGWLGRSAEAAAALAALARVSPGETVSGFRARSGYCDAPGVRRYFEGLRLAGMPA
jgi:class 3 adenylate cyclase/tetratricopeptide (TPR) repeat protein